MPSVKQALIIAAGNGSRLQPASGDLPKPLTPVCGVPLLKRLLHAAKGAGIERCVIVLGFQGEALKRALSSDPDVGIKLVWVNNEQWQRSNGISVLKAKEYLTDDFVLLMADHFFQTKTLATFLRRRPSPGEVILAVDHKIDQVYDIDDATKVQVEGTRVVDIGKKIQNFNAVDTGMFLCSPAIFSALEAAVHDGDCSLSEGMRVLISQEKLRTFDIKGGWWLDVDTPVALRHVERGMFDRLRLPTDTFLTRHLIRPMSLRLTKRLLKTDLETSHLGWLSLGAVFLAALLLTMGSYWSVLLGAVFFFVSTVLFMSSGELGKIKLQDSRRSLLKDLAHDHITWFVFLCAITLGFYRHEHFPPYVLIVGLITILDAALGLNLLYMQGRRLGQNSLDAVLSKGSSSETLGRNLLDLLLSNVKFMWRRDCFALLTVIFALFGKFSWIFWLAFFATHFLLLTVLYGQTRDWKDTAVVGNSNS